MVVTAKYCFLVGIWELTDQCEHDVYKAMKKILKNLANTVLLVIQGLFKLLERAHFCRKWSFYITCIQEFCLKIP